MLTEALFHSLVHFTDIRIIGTAMCGYNPVWWSLTQNPRDKSHDIDQSVSLKHRRTC